MSASVTAAEACGAAVVRPTGSFFCWLPKGHAGDHRVPILCAFCGSRVHSGIECPARPKA